MRCLARFIFIFFLGKTDNNLFLLIAFSESLSPGKIFFLPPFWMFGCCRTRPDCILLFTRKCAVYYILHLDQSQVWILALIVVVRYDVICHVFYHVFCALFVFQSCRRAQKGRPVPLPVLLKVFGILNFFLLHRSYS